MRRERGESVRTHDSMAGHVRVVTRAHDVPDRTRGQRTARDHADETVRGDAASRDPLHDAADRAGPRVRGFRHALIMPKRRRAYCERDRGRAARSSARALEDAAVRARPSHGAMYARGVDDNKRHLATADPGDRGASRGFRRASDPGAVPHRGREESGSPNLAKLLELEPGPTDADARAVRRDGVLKRREERKPELLALDVMAGVREYICEGRRLGLSIAIASSSPRDYVRAHLDRVGLGECWDVIVCREDAPRAKPAPDLYLRAVALLNVAPEEALALEDSANGIAAAKDAGPAGGRRAERAHGGWRPDASGLPRVDVRGALPPRASPALGLAHSPAG